MILDMSCHTKSAKLKLKILCLALYLEQRQLKPIEHSRATRYPFKSDVYWRKSCGLKGSLDLSWAGSSTSGFLGRLHGIYPSGHARGKQKKWQ